MTVIRKRSEKEEEGLWVYTLDRRKRSERKGDTQSRAARQTSQLARSNIKLKLGEALTLRYGCGEKCPACPKLVEPKQLKQDRVLVKLSMQVKQSRRKRHSEFIDT